MKVDVVVDMQYGSTAKGKVCAYLARNKNYDASVRVQSIQAGHTIYHKGKAYKMRTIPCAWVNMNTYIILGAGCFIDKQLLLDEIKMIQDAGVPIKQRLMIDYRATYVVSDDYKQESVNQLTRKIGSTSEGAGASLIRKIWRKSKPTRVCDDMWAYTNGLNVIDTIEFMNKQCNTVLLEGCQGTLLSVHTSPYYPFCTSRECTVSGIASEAGFSPKDISTIYGVFRTYPIRVGGNSGDTGGAELSWKEIAERSGNDRLIPEKTTVTNRERRIFEFSDEDFQRSIWLNKPDVYCLAFLDYVNYGDYGKNKYEELSEESQQWITRVEKAHQIKIGWVSTGEQPEHIIRR